jgi:hypothetical protein
MKINLALLLTAIVFAFAGSAYSQADDQWTYVTENDNYKVYIGKDSVKKVEGEKTMYDVWLKMECKTDCNDGYKSVKYSIQNWNLYCETSEYNVPKIIDHYTDDEENIYTNETISPILPNSPGEAILNYFCKKD